VRVGSGWVRVGRWVVGVWVGMGIVHKHVHNSFTRFHLWWGGNIHKTVQYTT